MESQAQYLERARAQFKIKSDSHIARLIGVSRQYIFDLKRGKAVIGDVAMVNLAEAAGLDVQEALLLRAAWTAKPETRPYYADMLEKLNRTNKNQHKQSVISVNTH